MPGGASRVGERQRQKAGEGRRRVIIEGVRPEIDCGRFPIKRTVDESVVVEADVFGDGHDSVSCRLLWKHRAARAWREAPMEPLGNDRWRASFSTDQLGRYQYTIEGWTDHFLTWRRDMQKRVAAGQDVSIDLLIGADLVEAAAGRARGRDRDRLLQGAARLRSDEDMQARSRFVLDDDFASIPLRYPDRTHATTYGRILEVVVDDVRARFSAWYELFPRSAGPAGRHGTFEDVAKLLPYVKELGFDVLYLPPIHPIGETNRKGRNNAPRGVPGDVGSPWGIGSRVGGHKAVHPELGTIDDLRRLVERARAFDIDVALDIAFQVSPDHPYVKEHPEWFSWRPDGTLKTAENPPKRYEDISNFDWLGPARDTLWEELESVFVFWIERGVRIFRVDNPHTKPIPFWEWVIRRLQDVHPDVVFLSEAFTRPKVMKRLAKIGFSQSYTYFTWRNFKKELQEYLEELTQSEVAEYMRGNLWPNTPDILPEVLQEGGRPAFKLRIALAATLSSVYGVYSGYELLENKPVKPGKEEYLDSEKYQLVARDWNAPGNIRPYMAALNRIRRENPALLEYKNLRFYRADNERVIFYGKHSRDGTNTVLVAVSMDPYAEQESILHVPLQELGVGPDVPFEVHELLSDRRALWQGPFTTVRLTPEEPAAIWQVLPLRKTEKSFDYYY
jgi:starch synthase (maltosyl-transferring)